MSISGGGLNIPELVRSGRNIRICDSLKSVKHIENSDNKLDLPWLVRQTALYHSFDIDTGKASWMAIKGIQLIKDRIQMPIRAQTGGKLVLISSRRLQVLSSQHWRAILYFANSL